VVEEEVVTPAENPPAEKKLSPDLLKSFLMLRFALENKMFSFKHKVMLHMGWEFLQRKDL
jgi:hypothetical protein